MTTAGPTTPRILRLALALRGGVSLAVWIGGAVAELDLLRRASLTDPDRLAPDSPEVRRRARIYRKLLNDNGFEHVEIDILAGTSAGGLNAVVLGLAQSFGVPLDDPVHRTWIGDGALWRLLRRPGRGRIPSLLDGDGAFYPAAHRALTDVVGQTGRPDLVQATQTVELSATLIEAPAGQLHDHRAGFTFVRRPGPIASGYSTLPQAVDGARSTAAALDRIAVAIRSTSSFPGAFEPARLVSTLGDLDAGVGMDRNMAPVFPYAVPPAAGSVPPGPTRRGATPADGADSDPARFAVVDGGLFDNIPIDRALDAIARAPADRPTRRRLVYLDPTPAAVAPALQPRRFDWETTILTALKLQQREENLQEELALVRGHNDRVMAQRGRDFALAASLRAGTPLPSVGPAAYLRTRIGTDTVRIGQLLHDPWPQVCTPPRTGMELTAPDETAALGIEPLLSRLYADPDLRAVRLVDGDMHALVEAGQILISWTQDAMRAEPVDSVRFRRLSRIKNRLYRCLTVAVEARRRTVDLPLALSVTSDGRLAALPDAVIASWTAQREETVPTAVVAALNCNTALNSDDVNVSEADFYCALAAWVPGAHETTPLLPALWSALTALHCDLIAAGEPRRDGPGWASSLYANLYRAPYGGWDVPTLVRSLAVTGVPGTAAVISFTTVSGDEPPRLPALTASVSAEAARAKLRRILQGAPESAATPSIASVKLAGASFSNFGGFLDWRWRAGDWRWGRLDAAAGIVRMLAEAGDRAVGAADAAAIAELQEAVVGQPESFTVDGRWVFPLDASGEVPVLSPRYRFAVVSRIVPLIWRALLPEPGTGTVARWLRWACVQAARVVSVPATLVADPLRLAAALVLILACVRTAAGGPANTVVGACAAVVLLASGGYNVVAAARGARRWSRARSPGHDPDDDPVWRRAVADADAGTRWWRIEHGVWAAVTLAAGVAVAVQVAGVLPRSTTAALVTAMFAAVGVQWWLSVRAMSVPPVHPVRRPLRDVAAVVVAGGALVIMWPIELPTPTDPRLLLPAIGVVTAVLVGLSTAGWVRRLPGVCAAVTTALVAVAVAWWFPSSAAALAALPVASWSLLLAPLLGLLPVRDADFGEPPVTPGHAAIPGRSLPSPAE
ncbi:DUF3376 domain-containing protein [Gordonia aichiensis]|uniref:DUF3376 domain-containing protein n=1 Tax=Gordonia aichiensis TaxID=36820 RepID=UPI0032670846